MNFIETERTHESSIRNADVRRKFKQKLNNFGN